MAKTSMGKRAFGAGCVLCVAGLVLLAAVAVTPGKDGGGSAADPIVTADALETASPTRIASRILEGKFSGATDFAAADFPPVEFSQEAVDASVAETVMADADAQVVSYVVAGSAVDVFDYVTEELASKGWIPAESGWEIAGSFVKEGGTYRWLFIMCYQVGDRTSLVMQYR